MDPLSVIAGTIAIVGAINATVTTIRSVHGVVKEIHELEQELVDLKIVLTSVQSFMEQPRSIQSIHDGRPQLLHTSMRLQSLLNEMNDLLKDRWLRRKSTGSVKVKLRGLLRIQKRFDQLRGSVLTLKVNLSAMVGVTIGLETSI